MSFEICTSSWFEKLPPEYARISISRSAPRGQSGYRTYRQLQPGAWFRTASVDEYRRRYFDEVLASLDSTQVVKELTAMAEGCIPALLCWENPAPGPEWCHRGYVSQWLHETLGLEVYEFGQEHFGFGACHPKLPIEFRS